MKPVEIEFLMRDNLSGGIDSARTKADLLDVSMKRLALTIGGVFSVQKAMEFGRTMLEVRGEVESLQISFETLLGNKGKANAFFDELKQYATNTPLYLNDLAKGAQMMLGFGIDSEKVIPTLKQIGDISMGNAERFNSLTLAFSQMSATGKLMGQDLLQMINAGFNPLAVMSEKTGKSVAQLKEEMSEGSITADMVAQAFSDATAEGGKFHGMLEKQSKGIKGSMSNLEGAIQDMFNDVGTKSQGMITDGIGLATSMVKNYEQIGKVLAGLIATYGSYKAAVMVVTAVENLRYQATLVQMAGMTRMQAITDVLRAKTALLNKTMLANPYVLAATALVALVAVMWAMYDSTTAAERAQERYNKKKEDAVENEKKHKQRLEELIEILQSEYTSSLDRIKAMNELKRSYPSLFQKYIDEKGHVTDLIALWKEYNEEVTRNKVVQNKKNASDLKQVISEQKRFLELMDMGQSDRHKTISGSKTDKDIWRKYNMKGTYNIKKEIEANEKELWKWEQDVRDDNFAQWQIDLKSKTDHQIKEVRAALVRRAQAANGDKHLLAALGKRIMVIDAEQESRKESSVTYGTLYTKAQKEWEEAKQALEDIEKDKDKYSKDAYDKAKSRKEAAEKSYKSLGGKSDKELSKEENAEKKAAENANREKAEKAEREKKIAEYTKVLSEQEKQSEFDIRQASIDAMNEGTEKEQATINLNYDKLVEANRKRQEQWVKELQNNKKLEFENENPDYKKKGLVVPTVTANDLSVDQKDQLKGYTDAANSYKEDAETKLLNELSLKYQDYTDQRLAIEKKFNDDIAALQIQREKYQGAGDNSKVQQINRAIAQATKAKGESLVGFDYEQLKKTPEYVRAFENLKQTSTDTLNSLLDQLENAKSAAAQVLSPDQLREYTGTIQSIMDELDARNPFQSLADKKMQLAEAEEELAKAKMQLDAVNNGAQIQTGVKNTKYNAGTGKIESEKTYLSASEAAAKYSKAQDKVSQKSSQVRTAEKKVTDQIDELSKAISDVGASIGGPAGEIISLIGEIGSFTMMAINGVKTAADTSAQAISTVEKASVILMIISAAIQLATKVASFFAADYSDYNAAKENYEKYVEVLDVVIAKQKELVETLTGKEAVKASKDALGLIEKQAQAARNLGKERLNAGASAGSHSIGVRIRKGMSSAGWNEARNALGVGDYNKIKDGRMEGLFDLSVQQLEKLQMEAPEFWAKLDGDVREYLEQIIACNENAEEMKNALNESLTQVSFDSVYDGFLDALSDMDSSAEDFAGDFEKYMQRAILNTMLAEKYKDKLNKWYESFSKANADGNIDPDEYKELQKEWNEIVSGAIADRDNLKGALGWKGEEENESQSGKSGAFNSMSQEQGTKLEGLFTALQMHAASIDANLENVMTAINNALEKLAQIEENTSYCKFLEQMAEDIGIIKRDGLKMQ